MVETRDNKMLKTIQLPPNNYEVTYFQALEEVHRSLGQKLKKFISLEKMQILSKIVEIRDIKKVENPSIAT